MKILKQSPQHFLSSQALLEELTLTENDVGRLVCLIALGTTLERWQAPKLRQLDLSFNDIDDEGLQGLEQGQGLSIANTSSSSISEPVVYNTSISLQLG